MAHSDVALSLRQLVRSRNRELLADAAFKFGLGVLFTAVTFGIMLWLTWIVGFLFSHLTSLDGWQFAFLVTGIFFVVAVWSAWRRVNPLLGLRRLSDRELMLTLISQLSPHVLYFSPRHASAGLAVILIGGPANVIEAFGIWAHRLRASDDLLIEAAHILVLCTDKMPVEDVRVWQAVLLLKRVALIRVTLGGLTHVVEPTEKGLKLLKRSGKKKKARAD